MNGIDLLAEFRSSGADDAFSGLVRRYTNLVFSAARRRLNNVSMAEEATQTVFITLATTPPKLRNDAELVAWLHRTAVNASIDLWRSESRRHIREERAAVMQPTTTENENATWEEIAPIVDEALNELNDADRHVVLLRFFEHRSMRELGASLGISEDAAKMRVSRAMEHLRGVCAKRGVICAAGVLGGLLMERSVEAASASLVLTLATLEIPAGAAAGTAGTLLTPFAKMALMIGVAAIVGTAAIVWMRSKSDVRRVEMVDAAQAVSNHSSVASSSEATPAIAEASTNATTAAPDPVSLLNGVARARNRVHSGEMEFDLATYDSARDIKGTNYVKLKARFDGIRRRFESFDREYSYTEAANDDPGVQAQVDQMTQDQAVTAGLVKPFESHRVTTYDGTRLLDYWENDGKPWGARIQDPAKGTIAAVFDPRCMGLSATRFVWDTVESCLSYDSTDSIALAGEELLDGISTWHVRVRQNSMEKNFWLEKAHPTRVLKYAFNGSTVVGKYDDANAEDPIPIETTASLLHGTKGGGTAITTTVITRHDARFNIPVDPDSWTLAGLDMKIGTDVADDRLMRMIGYWNGTGLSEQPPGGTAEGKSAPDTGKLMALIDSEPYSHEALEAAQWIISNTPDGPEVEDAAEAILDNHIDDPNLLPLCLELERLRPRCSGKLLEALVEKNPSPSIRGNACLALATLRKADAKYGENQKATVEAEKLYDRVIGEFGREKRNGSALADLAKPELGELRNLTVGKPAPEIEGEDLEGRTLKWSDYRGQVVMLIFWGRCGGCRPEVAPLLKLLERYSGKPFAIVGVYCDDDPAEGKEIAEKMGMTWPSFRDDRSGPISKAWNNNEWPVIQIIDAKGIIRYRNKWGDDACGAVDKLMNK